MIAIQKIGKSFSGALKYNLKKLAIPDLNLRAELLATNFALLETKYVNKEIRLLRSLRPNLNRYVYNAILSFPKKEKALSNEKILSIALDYLEACGFTNNLYIIFRHHDTSNPHLHLIANRIAFDGSVVSESNNYRTSKIISRELEKRYDLIPEGQSNHINIDRLAEDQLSNVTRNPNEDISFKAPTKGEIEMVLHTGKPSHKMVLQEKLRVVLKQRVSLSQFIALCQAHGILLLFKQATAGRVLGVTYFYKDFKVRGRSLGHQCKWGELIKYLDYEQNRDSKAISQANERILAVYGFSGGSAGHAGVYGQGSSLVPGANTIVNPDFGSEDRSDSKGLLETNKDDLFSADGFIEYSDTGYAGTYPFEKSDDLDDEKVLGKERRGRIGR